jgi:hypothetical protein
MSRGRDSNELHPLFDVPGTGFRDREDSAMYNQYHKTGWQAKWNADGKIHEERGANPVHAFQAPAACVVFLPRVLRRCCVEACGAWN